MQFLKSHGIIDLQFVVSDDLSHFSLHLLVLNLNQQHPDTTADTINDADAVVSVIDAELARDILQKYARVVAIVD